MRQERASAADRPQQQAPAQRHSASSRKKNEKRLLRTVGEPPSMARATVRGLRPGGPSSRLAGDGGGAGGGCGGEVAKPEEDGGGCFSFWRPARAPPPTTVMSGGGGDPGAVAAAAPPGSLVPTAASLPPARHGRGSWIRWWRPGEACGVRCCSPVAAASAATAAEAEGDSREGWRFWCTTVTGTFAWWVT